MIDCLKVLFLRPGTAEFSAVGRADEEIGKKNIKNLKKHTYVYYMSVCLTSGSCQQKKTLARSNET